MSSEKICLSVKNFEKLLELGLRNCNSKPNSKPNNFSLIEPTCSFSANNYNSIDLYDSKSGATSSVKLYNSDGYCCPTPLNSILNENTTPIANLNSLFNGISPSSLIIVLLGGLVMSTSPPDVNGKIDPGQFNVPGFTTSPLAGYSARIIQNNNPPTPINLNLYVYNNDTGKIQTYTNLQRRVVIIKGKTYYFTTTFDQNDRTQNYYRISTPFNGGVGILPEILIIGPEISLDCQSGKCNKPGSRCLSGNCPDGWEDPTNTGACGFCPGFFIHEGTNCKTCSSHFQTLPGDPKLCRSCVGNWTETLCNQCPQPNFIYDTNHPNCDTCAFGWSSTPIGGTTPVPGLKMCNYCSPNYDNSQGFCFPCSGNGDVDNPTLGTCKCNKGYSGNKCEIECSGNGKIDPTSGNCQCASGWSGDMCEKKDSCVPNCSDPGGSGMILNCGQNDGCGGQCPNTLYNSNINNPIIINNQGLKYPWKLYVRNKLFSTLYAFPYPYPNDPRYKSDIYFYENGNYGSRNSFSVSIGYDGQIEITDISGTFMGSESTGIAPIFYNGDKLTLDPTTNIYNIYNQTNGNMQLVPGDCDCFHKFPICQPK